MPMPSSRAALLLTLAATGLACGCGIDARALSSPSEYEAYRTTRAAYTVEDRLVACERYLSAYPEGRFASEVKAYFDEQEARFYERQAHSKDGLGWYLTVLPAGPHAATASLTMADLEAQAREQRNDALLAKGKSTERRLARAARLRKAVTEQLSMMLAGLTAPEGWGLPTWEQPAPRRAALRGWPEPGSCDEQRCERSVSLPFQIPRAGGGLDERSAELTLRLTLAHGDVVQGELRGPALFSRIWEAERGRALPPDPLEARAEAVTYAVDLVSGAIEAQVPAARCEQGITPPVIFKRACDGWQVQITIGDGPSDDDVLFIEGPRAR